MGVKFAGSRSIDERRRRRLAGENESDSLPVSAGASKMNFWVPRQTNPQGEEVASSPLGSIVPRSRIKIWGLCAAIPLIGLLLVLLTHTKYLSSDPRLQSILDLESGHLWRYLKGTLFLGSAALCWLISWFRSASDRDFEGCYKSWYFSGWVFLMFGFVAGCDAHLVFSQILGDYIRIQSSLMRTLIWVVPMSAFLIEPMRCFTREMWHCRRSLVMMSLSILACLAYLEMQILSSTQVSLAASQTFKTVLATASIFVPAFCFSALLSQVYYAMYVSSDPVPRRQSWTLQAIRWGKQKATTLLGMAGSYSVGKMKSVTSSAQSRIANRSENKKKTREERKADRKLAKEKVALEAAKKKETAKKEAIARKEEAARKKEEVAKEKAAMKEAVAASKIAAREKIRAEKEEAKQAKITERAEIAERRKKAKAEPVIEAETVTSKTKPRRKTPFKQIAADQHEKKQPAASDRVDKFEDREKTSKPRVRLKAQNATADSESEQDDTQVNDIIPQKEISFKGYSDSSVQIDPSELKGLSKKERRKLRKMHREQQRNKAG